MRTLVGQEAIDLADQFNLPLFDRYYKSDVTVQQAKLFIRQQREPSSFILENWPESDREAEQIVLRQFHAVLIAQQLTEATIPELWERIGESPLHPLAAELAADRLVEQEELERVEDAEDYSIYRIPRTTHFTDTFLDGLRSIVCEDCAHLSPTQPFHKTCLMSLVDYLINGDFSLNDVTEKRAAEDLGRGFQLLKSPMGARWLSETVSATRLRLKTVVKPILKREHVVPAQRPSADLAPSEPVTYEPSSYPAGGETLVAHVAGTGLRTKISKAELIRYLNSVEILEEDGEVAELRQERDELVRRVESKQRELQQLERERAFLEGQCAELQRDMDTLLQALQIAKRRGHGSSSQVIDGEISEPQPR